MSREIKFRGLTISGQWVYGFVHTVPRVPPKYQTVEAGTYISNSAGSPFAYQVRPETVGEFTGLPDKNEKEMYEKDIVKGQHYMNGAWHRIIGKIVFVSAKFCIDGIGNYGGIMRVELDPSYEVIGNIYENLELLADED